MKTYIFVGVLLTAILVGGFYWQSMGSVEKRAVESAEEEDRRIACEQFLAVALFPNGEAADEFMAACLRGEPVFQEEMDGEAQDGTEEPVASSSSPAAGPGCVVGGCSGQICGEEGEVEGTVTTCEWLEEYACYQKTRCERQTNGQCGWTENTEFGQCMTEAKAGGSN